MVDVRRHGAAIGSAAGSGDTVRGRTRRTPGTFVTDTATALADDTRLTDTAPAPTADLIPAAGPAPGWRVVHRTIIRGDQDLDIRPLYINGLSSFGGAASAPGSPVRPTTSTSRATSVARARQEPVRRHGRRSRRERQRPRPVHRRRRRGARPERRLTFGTYFNAFPASYWRRWTDVRDRPARHPRLRPGHAPRLPLDREGSRPARRLGRRSTAVDQQTLVFDLPLRAVHRRRLVLVRHRGR